MEVLANITPAILCGGSGTRLWPLSRKSFPKQFVPVVNNKSLFELTLQRLNKFGSNMLIIASEDHRFFITDTMNKLNLHGDLLLEPEAKNTAAAMALAAFHETGQDDDLLLFCPADHYIPDSDAFHQTILRGVPDARDGAIVTFGIVPAFPSTAYGYIKKGEATKTDNFKVDRFVEKPSEEKAKSFLLAGDMLWNAGIFLCTRSTLRHSLEIHASDIATACKTAMSQSAVEPFKEKLAFIRPSKEAFATSPANSIDYAVMENHENVTVVPFTGQWSDVGSWNAIADLTESDEQQNRIEGNGLTHLSENTYIHASNRLVVSIGTKDLMIIDTTDAVLVVDRSQAEKVKDVWAELENKEYKEATEHRKVYRPWGWYDSVDNGDRFQVKRICVKPGAKLSLQKHFHRAEHWIVVRGTAEVTRGEETFLLSENQSTYIPIGTVHRLANPGKINLEMIEVQSGRYLGEDDIVRLEDTYGRMASEPDEVS